MQKLLSLIAADEGSTAVEYAVMLALIIVVCITAIANIGSTNSGSLKDSMEKLGTAMGS